MIGLIRDKFWKKEDDDGNIRPYPKYCLEDAVAMLKADESYHEIFDSHTILRVFVDYDHTDGSMSNVSPVSADEHLETAKLACKSIITELINLAYPECETPEETFPAFYELCISHACRKTDKGPKYSYHVVAKNVAMRLDEMGWIVSKAVSKHDGLKDVVDTSRYVGNFLTHADDEAAKQSSLRAVLQSKFKDGKRVANSKLDLKAGYGAMVEDHLLQNVQESCTIFPLTNEERARIREDYGSGASRGRDDMEPGARECSMDELKFLLNKLPASNAQSYVPWFTTIKHACALAVMNRLDEEAVSALIQAFSKRGGKYQFRRTSKKISDMLREVDRERDELSYSKYFFVKRLSEQDKVEYTQMMAAAEPNLFHDVPGEESYSHSYSSSFSTRDATLDQLQSILLTKGPLTDADVWDMYRIVQPGETPFASDGSKVYRIHDISGVYKLYEEKASWQHDIANHIIAELRPPIKKILQGLDAKIESAHARNAKAEVKALLGVKTVIEMKTSKMRDHTGFMGNAVAELFRRHVVDSRISKKNGLDSMVHLMGAENGVFDFTQRDENGDFVFRKARRDEYVSKSVGFNFVRLSKDNKQYMYMKDVVLKDMFVQRDKREGLKGQYGDFATQEEDPEGYATMEAFGRRLGMMLTGNTTQSCMFFVGRGANGKSIIIALIRCALGEYCAVLPGVFWTCVPTNAESAAPMELYLRGAKACVTTEVTSTEKNPMNASKFKDLTGGDERAGRFLFSSVIHNFYVDATPIISINSMPEHWTERNEAVIRRPVAVPFRFRFVSDVELDRAVAKAANSDVDSREFKNEYANVMLNIMLDYLRDYLDENPFVKNPWTPSMRAATASLNDTIDPYTNFIKARLIYTDDKRFFVPTEFLHEISGIEVSDKVFGKNLARAMKDIENASSVRPYMRFGDGDFVANKQTRGYHVILKRDEDIDALLARTKVGCSTGDGIKTAYQERRADAGVPSCSDFKEE